MNERALYRAWFLRVSGFEPFPYQVRLATDGELPDLLRAPTGAGKTAAVVLAWLWRALESPRQSVRAQTPRRLIYCLPMRTLVEQTYSAVARWLEAGGLRERVGPAKLMGGAIDRGWDDEPDRHQILIGTQDQLLSRALNRGYATSRYRWPVHFAWLHSDCLWVMDEVQLMGAGLATTAQLQGLRDQLGCYGTSASIWMSATLDADRLRTVDHPMPAPRTLELGAADRQVAPLRARVEARKQLASAGLVLGGKDKVDGPALAERILAEHVPGTLTLVVCNQVGRATATYEALRRSTDDVLLVHSRFRAAERSALNRRLLSEDLGGIVVATQVVEAGLDLDAHTLFTELAPWSSVVQRVGRCNRRGLREAGRVFWIDLDLSKKNIALPYEAEALEWTRGVLSGLGDVGPASLAAIEPPRQRAGGLVLRRRDLLELFDTSPDLAGMDIDIDRFIRDADDSDLFLAWRRWEGDDPRPVRHALHSSELCRVSVAAAARFLKKARAWTWDPLEGRWVSRSAGRLRPGLSLLLHTEAGGYREDLGFTGNPKHRPEPVSLPLRDEGALARRYPLERDGGDPLSTLERYVTLETHAGDTARFAAALCEALDGLGLPAALIERAARWHDLGKAHPYFQETLTQRDEALQGTIWAKSDHRRPHPDTGQPGAETLRPHFRHELASALVALDRGEPFLLAYLVAAHHGKVRLAIRPRPGERAPAGVRRYALGVREGDALPEVDLGGGLIVPPCTLKLDCMSIGEGSWTERALALLAELGPFRLAALEACLRVADWRASRYRQDGEEVSGD